MSAMPGSILDRAIRREPLDSHDGRSGAVLERVVLDDGTKLVVKTAAPGPTFPEPQPKILAVSYGCGPPPRSTTASSASKWRDCAR